MGDMAKYMAKYKVTIDVDPRGERWAMLLDQSGMPAFYPGLFVTTVLRNKGKATATQEQALTAIKALLEFCDAKNINLIERIQSRIWLTTGELEALSDAVSKKRRGVLKSNVISLKNGYSPPPMRVQKNTQTMYMHRIAAYVRWLCEELLGRASDRFTVETTNAIDWLETAIRTRGRALRSRCDDDEDLKKTKSLRGVTDEQEVRLFEVLRPRSPLNPFEDPGVQFRNYLIVKLLRVTGTRGGELLNIRVRDDIDWSARQLAIVRRADTPQDTRRRQALVKTNQRVLPLTEQTLEEIRSYVVGVRKRIPNAARCPYLFVSHKSGPTQGHALSLSSLREIFATIRRAFPELDFSAHDLRHRWNESYSVAMNEQDKIGYAEAEQLRNLLEGWSPSSTMGQRYNKRYIREASHEAMLAVAKRTERAVECQRNKKLNDG